jgi:hypothetical protein
METITLEELPFKFALLEKMKKDNLTIEKLKGKFTDYYYLTSSRIHQVYSFNGCDSPILLTEIHLFDLQHALDNPSFKEKVLEYLGTTQNV